MHSAVTPERRRAIIRNQPNAFQANSKKRRSAVTVYSGIFLLIITLLTLGYGGSSVTPEAGVLATTQASPQSTPVASPEKISVDQLTAASAVTHLAETANLPVAGDLREATTTLYIQKQLAQTDAEVISKPQIIQPSTFEERGLASYTVREGDNLPKIAAQFGISVQTLKWANDMTSDDVEVGRTLAVPQVDGVVYTVRSGDTLESLADRYKVDAERVVLHNDLVSDEPLVEGMKLVLPNGDLPETERPGYVAPRPAAPSYSGGSSMTTGMNYGYARMSAGNRYAAGNCTWYVYERRASMGRPIGSFWGNAYSWASSARMAGFAVDQNPQPGDIFQTSFGGGGYGHVGIVERVDGENIYVSDMNYAGYNVVTHRTIPRSALGGYNFIK